MQFEVICGFDPDLLADAVAMILDVADRCPFDRTDLPTGQVQTNESANT